MQHNLCPEKLCKHLISKGYDASSISERNTNLYGLELSLLEVKSAKYVIQTFVLMSNEARNSRSRVPIYKTYTQETPKGNVIYPACCIACFDGNDWSFFNASETCEPCRGEFVNYDKAKERFNTRLDVENKCSKVEKLSIHSRIAGCLLLALLAGFFVIKNEI